MMPQRIGSAAAFVVALATFTASCAPKPARDLVVVVVDTLRADHVGAYGYSRATTPTIDALAKRGTRFSSARTTSSWTVPSVASLFTSLYPSQHGAYVPGPIHNLTTAVPQQLADGIETIADRLHARGYATALYSANPFLYGRFKSGFDVAEVERIDAGRLTDAALAWLARTENRPRFLYVQYMDAHQPNAPPEPYFSMFSVSEGGAREARHGDWSYGNETGAESAEFARFRAHRIAAYDGSIRYIDDQIARLLAAIPEDRRPLVVVTSDHGEEFWDHAAVQAEWRDDPRGFWGVGHGQTLFEEILAVPLIVVGGRFDRGRESLCPASLLDLAPTIFAATALDPAPSWRGADLGALAHGSGGAGETCRDRPVAAESLAYGPPSRALVAGRLKLMQRGDRTLLYDLRRDPGEKADLAARFPRETAALVRELDRRLSTSAAVAGAPMAIDDALRRELEALGYL
jgi:arylsulfatase A-like enzyme